MKKTHQQHLIAFASGLIFSLGLALSGMTQPQKIINFLDPWNWDPSLLFVMLGAAGTHAIIVFFTRHRSSPFIAHQWHTPQRRDITLRLVIGSAVFGIGWGLGGFCPGPAITSLPYGDLRVLIFVGFMLVGLILGRWSSRFLKP